MNESKTTLLNQFILIQNKQIELDYLKKENRKISKGIRSLSQEIPKLLRELNLK